MDKRGRVVGICGREGAGKSTLAKFLSLSVEGESAQGRIVAIHNGGVIPAITNVIFGRFFPGVPDRIWGMTEEVAQDTVRKLLITHFGENLDLDSPRTVDIPESGSVNSEWIEYSLADPLKYIAALLVPQIPHWVLRGITPKARDLRETMLTPAFSVTGAITGRRLLEYLGTDVFRNHFDPWVWVKIFQRECHDYQSSGFSIVVPDIRFDNELEALDSVNGTLLLVYRDERDLILTESDQKTHPAKWKFLTFYQKASNLKKIHNDSTLEALKEKLHSALSS